jgi:CheY-like chemotaxis protein
MREGFGMDVLLVNSDPMMTKMVRFLLEDRGYRCRTATPSQALAQAFGGEVVLAAIAEPLCSFHGIRIWLIACGRLKPEPTISLAGQLNRLNSLRAWK